MLREGDISTAAMVELLTTAETAFIQNSNPSGRRWMYAFTTGLSPSESATSPAIKTYTLPGRINRTVLHESFSSVASSGSLEGNGKNRIGTAARITPATTNGPRR